MTDLSKDQKARFEKALVRLLLSFNYLDTNVGLCISHLANPSDPKKSYPSLATMTAGKKFEELRKLFRSNNIAVGENASAEFMQWYKSAAKARAIRNRYVHGNWQLLWPHVEKSVVVEAPPWMKEKLGPLSSEDMSLSNLEAIADEVDGVLKEFMSLRRKYGV